MVTIVGWWDMGYDAPITELNRWMYMLKDFDINLFHMIPVSGISDPKLDEYATIQEVFDLYKGINAPAVFLDENATATLDNFVHPENAIYVFGKSNYSPLGHMRTGDVSIKIDTPKVGGLWGDQACSLVLYDRLKKA